MDLKTHKLSLQRYKVLLNCCALFLISLGCITMLGWIFKISALLLMVTTTVPMQFNTSLSFALTGVILILYHSRKYFIVNMLSLFIFFLTVLTLCEYFFYIDLGIDQLFIKPFIHPKTANPGRMAPNTALCFLLFSSFIFLSQIKSPRILLLVVLLPWIFGVLGLISLIGYMFGIEQAYAWGALTHMALFTAIAFLVLSTASQILLKLTKKLSYNHLSKLFDYAIFSTSLLFFFLLWQVLSINSVNKLKTESLTQANLIATKLFVEINGEIDAINRLHSRFTEHSYSSDAALSRDVEAYFKNMHSLEQISFISNSKIKMTLINPNIKYNQQHKISDLCRTAASKFKIDALTTNEKLGYLCLSNKNFNALINLKTLIANYSKKDSKRFVISFADEGHSIYQSGKEEAEHIKFWNSVKTIDMYGKEWTISIYPTPSYIKHFIGRIPSLILFLGSFISFLVLYALRNRRELMTKEKALLSAESIKSTILNSTLEGVFGVDQQFTIFFMNQSAQELLGLSFDARRTLKLNDITQDNAKRDSITSTIMHSLIKGSALTKDSGVFIKANKSKLSVRYSSSPIIEDERITGAIIVFSDNSERMEYEQKLQELAHYDTLTKLPNRFSIIKHIDECIARASRLQYTFSLCFIDIDHFKTINDTYGHHVGDLALQHVSQQIRSVIRKNDYLGRLAGDEFCLILDGIFLKQDTDRVLAKIYHALKTPLIIENTNLFITLSIGVIPYDLEETPEELLIKADGAMYLVKRKIEQTLP